MLQEQTHWQDSAFNNASSTGTLHGIGPMTMPTWCVIFYLYAIWSQEHFLYGNIWMTGIFLLRTPWHQLLKLGNKTFWSACLRVFLYVALSWRRDKKNCEPQFKWHNCFTILISCCIIELLLWLCWWWSVPKDSRLSLYWPMVISCL